MPSALEFADHFFKLALQGDREGGCSNMTELGDLSVAHCFAAALLDHGPYYNIYIYTDETFDVFRILGVCSN